jgi:hypothetical protein
MVLLLVYSCAARAALRCTAQACTALRSAAHAVLACRDVRQPTLLLLLFHCFEVLLELLVPHKQICHFRAHALSGFLQTINELTEQKMMADVLGQQKQQGLV